MSDLQYFTQEGLQKLKEELENLKSVERPKVIQQIEILETKVIYLKMQNMMQPKKHQVI